MTLSKDNPLIIGDGLECVISNPFKWVDLLEYNVPDFNQWFEMYDGVSVKGSMIRFKNEEAKLLFLLMYGP